MDTLKTIPFDFDGKKYEIRVARFPTEIKVRVFLNGKPANPWSYSCTYENADEFNLIMGEQAWEHLVKQARADVESRAFEQVQHALEEFRKTIFIRVHKGEMISHGELDSSVNCPVHLQISEFGSGIKTLRLHCPKHGYLAGNFAAP